MEPYEPRHARPPEPLRSVKVCPLCEDTPGFEDEEGAVECPLCWGKGWLPPATAT